MVKLLDYTIHPSDTDMFDFAPPAALLHQALYSTMLRAEYDGLPAHALLEKLNAVWMLAAMRLELRRPIHPLETVRFSVSSRLLAGGTYTRRIQLDIGEEQVGDAFMNFIVVEKDARRIVRPKVLEEIWQLPMEQVDFQRLRRLRPPENWQEAGTVAIRCSDCDANGHLYSMNYASLACDCAQYWEGERKFMRAIQVDFSSEVRPGTLLQMERETVDGVVYIRGVKPEGATAFYAACEMESLP